MMRKLALLVATVAVATNCGAQTPLTVDTSFRFYYTPEVMDYWGGVITYWEPSVGFIYLRQNGGILLSGGQLMPVEQIPWGFDRQVIIATTGGPVEFINHGGNYRHELHETNQYFGSNKRFNYDGTVDWSFSHGSQQFDVNNRNPFGWYFFDDLSGFNTGYFTLSDDSLKYVLIKVDEWGLRDTTFQLRHAAHPLGPVGHYIHPLNNGQFLLNGRWTQYDGQPSGTVVRINADGSKDTTFHFASWKGEVAAIHEQPDGKVIMAGRIWMNGIADTLHLVRVNLDGSLDNTFNNFLDFRTGTHAFSSMCGVNVLERIDTDRIMVGGHFTTIDGEPRGCIACVDNSGNLLDCWAGGGLHPVSFTPGGGPNFGLSGFKCLDNGECYIFGSYHGFTDANGFHPEQICMSRIFMPTVGIEEPEAQTPALRLWPNPGDGLVNFHWLGHTKAMLEVRDALGQLVHGETYVGGNWQVDLSHLPSGLYTVLLSAPEGGRATTKWIKQ